MSKFSLTLPLSNTLCYTPMDPHHHQHQQKPFSLFFPLNHFPQNDDVSDNSSTSNTHNSPSETSSSHPHHHSNSDHREPMFEKSLTPSDVGKLNRLVIPKQHAEKFFPLAGDSGAGGLLLEFEDENGKSWRFRYSYWNSSQSYVLTKGWSRYVKEKKLDAGDVVLFDRHRVEPDRFFIGWRRRRPVFPVRIGEEFRTGGGGTCSSFSSVSAVKVQQSYPAPQLQGIPAFQYRPAGYFHAGTSQQTGRSEGMNSKTVRLFGVNLECQLEEDNDTEPQTSDGSSLSSQVLDPAQGFGSGFGLGPGFPGYNYFGYVGYPPNHHHNYMDINFSQDANQMRNRPG